jgi:Outer membrane protein beta-barrel domain
MKKLFVIALAFLATTTAAVAQKKDSVAPVTRPVPAITPVAPAPAKKDWSKITLSRRANDHLMFELGYNNWAGATDTIHINGFNRTVNLYFMFDFPFKTDPRFSIGAGVGLGCDNTFFNKQELKMTAQNTENLAFTDETNQQHYKKNKLVTTYLQIPLELRYAVDPENTNSSWKFAIGVRVGLLMSAYYKGKTLQNDVGQTIANYTIKESSKTFFNTPQLVGTARINKGVIGVFGQFQATSLLKAAGSNPSVYPFAFGIVLSGL